MLDEQSRPDAGTWRILELIAAGVALSTILEQIILAAEAGLDGVLGSVLLVDEATSTVGHGAAPNLPEGFKRRVDGMRLHPSTCSWGAAFFRASPVVVADIASDPLWQDYRDLALSYGLRSGWAVPVKAAGVVVGVVVMYACVPRSPTAQELEVARQAADLASLAIGKANLEAEAQTLRREASQGERMAREWSRLRDLLWGAPAIVALTRGPEHTLEFVNHAFVRALDRPRSELLGRPVSDVLQFFEPAGIQQMLDRAFREGVACSGDEMRLALRRRDGIVRETFLNFVCQPVRDPTGQVSGLFIHAVSVTRLVKAREELVRLQRQKNEFFATLAHDLRNPLLVIDGNAQLLLRTFASDRVPDAEFVIQCLEEISGTARRVFFRTGDLVDLSKEQAGGEVQLMLEPVALVPLVRRVIADFSKTGYENRIVLQAKKEQVIGEWDPLRLEAALVNLIGNALKYSLGMADVTVTVDADDQWATVEVADRGPGIREEELPQVFESFWRSESSGKVWGSGIGLASVKQTVTLHGGEVAVRSAPDFGSVFTIRLPYKAIGEERSTAR
jgi:signal transduction histidine kinase